ncbi:aldehyde dehydrogenase [Protomyces lactucae-debilis]|uniref:Aldehyde dehydrogenase n=1 Tax=Protomyces lactucae-debilis TaxID=2754530 RepID=A0A1Y2FK54_PROLT|nr:aldehyde dehydrogenase [Protomyces lactucae-debilis]ORY83606.1 aldehyde dehydrogenase [Protomyces lactucae-debilis]
MVQIKTLSPVDQSVVVERTEATDAEINTIFANATKSFPRYAKLPLSERIQIATRFLDLVADKSDELSEEITRQMGRPIRYSSIEIKTAIMRGKYMVGIAEEQLADVQADNSDPKIRKFLRKVPKGPVFVIGAWNYPWLITINAVLPALIAGNTVVLKPSPQTPLVAERFVELYSAAGLPEHVLQCIHVGSPDIVSKICQRPELKHISFTGSVAGGRAVDRASALAERDGFISVGLELGGKDPAYVRADIDPKVAAVELVDGAMFNSGQSCCAVERIYVDASIHDAFVEAFVAEAKALVLGDPNDPATTLGPVVSLRSAEAIRAQVSEAVSQGAKAHIDSSHFKASKEGSCFVAPQVLTNVNHSMKCMIEETFGPTVAIQKVSSDEEAIRLMNDSQFGLTASIWTSDKDGQAEPLLRQVEAGTVFMNRCDYPDPSLAWTGCKQSGRGITLSQ